MNDYRLIDQQNKGIIFLGDKDNVGKFIVGKNCDLNDAIIDKTGGVFIGDRVHFGHQVMLLTTSHPPSVLNGNDRKKVLFLQKIEIEEDVYIGSRSLILGGVKIGKGSYIGAGSLVLKNTKIGEFELWVGHPAKFIRKLK